MDSSRERLKGSYMRYTIILGAGASSPFIGTKGRTISTSTIVDALTDASRWKQIISQFTGYYTNGDPDIIFNIDELEVVELITDIRDKVNMHFSNATFDQIIHILEPICLRLSNDIFGGVYENLNEEFVDLRAYNYPNTTKDGWPYVPYLCREVICGYINDIYKKRLNKKWIFIPIISRWLLHLANRNEMQIYSFNYDSLIADSIAKTGISEYFVGGIFDEDGFWSSSNTFCQLHGSVKSYILNGKYCAAKNGEAAQQIRMEKACSRVVDDSFKFSEKGSLGKHYNTWLVTAMEKIETFANFPFSVFFQKMSTDIGKADRIVIIGSSLGDIHVNAFIMNAIRVQKKKVVLVTRANVDEFADHFQMFAINEDNSLINLIVRMGIPIRSKGFTIEQAVLEFKTRIRDEYRRRKFFYLNSDVAIVPDGSEFVFRDKYLLDRIFP
jgi:hypothetical protein